MKSSYSILAYLLACLLIIGVAFAYPKWKFSGSNATISWDVTGYYLYLPATFIHHDLAKLGFKDEMMKKYNPAGSFYHAVPLENGNYVMKYPIGLAIQMFPSFLLGWLIAKIGAYPVDGFSYPFQLCITWGSILVSFIGLWFGRKILLRYFDEKVTAVTLVLLAFATNYLNYSAIDGAMAHNYLFTLYTLLIWNSIKWYESPNIKRSIAIGCIIGLATITRPVEIISVLIPLLWGIQHWKDFVNRLQFWQKHFSKLAVAMLCTILVGSIQMIYWKIYSGDFLFYSYEDQGFDWLSPHIKNVLISYRKGWFVYTPLMFCSIVGFVFLWLKNRALFWSTAIFFALNLYIVSAWSIWWYGGSLGQRALVQSYAILIFPLAAFVSFILNSKNWIKNMGIGIFLFCTWFNLVTTYQSHTEFGPLVADRMTEAYYWRIFGRLSVPDTDRKLLDTNEDFTGRRFQVKEVFRSSFEEHPDTNLVQNQHSHAGKRAIFLSKDAPYAPEMYVDASQIKSEWIRVEGYFFAPQKEWNMWKMPQFIIEFQKNGQVIKSRFIRLSRMLPPHQHTNIHMDVKVPKESFNRVKIGIWTAGSPKPLYIDDIRMETFNE